MPSTIPLSPAVRHIWSYLTTHPGEWVEAKTLVADKASYRTVARLLKAFVDTGLIESRPTFPAWQYRHDPIMRRKASAIAKTLDDYIA